MEIQGTIEELKEIVERLRKDNGCPWDRVQTHASLRSCLREETAELLAAIRIYEQTGNCGNMREELGDLLFQVVIHSVIAQEEGLFTLQDVTADISKKMIHRHPHVFGERDIQKERTDDVTWEQLKQSEKEKQDWRTTPLRDIPQELPALTRAEKIYRKRSSVYGEEESIEEIVKRLEDSIHRLGQQTSVLLKGKQPDYSEKKMLEDDLGRILLLISDLSSVCRLSMEQKLQDDLDEIVEFYEP